MNTAQDVAKLVDERGIEFFLCSFVEMSGAPKAKVVPAHHLEDMAQGSAGFAGFAAGEMGQGPHDPDMSAVPDFASLTILPWRPTVAWVASNIQVNNAPWPYCPRSILQRQVQKAHAAGYVLKTGVEPEFMLIRRNGDGTYAPYDPLDTLSKPCYDLRALNRNLDFMTTVLKYMHGLGWDPYANDHEDANCQFEINWRYADCLTSADRHTFFRWMVRTVAEQHGCLATFMPKPFANLTGNGAHFHLSLWDAEKDTPLFADERDENGLSKLAYDFIGGLKQHAKAVAAVTAPIVNSYKRLIRGAPRSGATWAPVYITYGGSNRTQMIRIPAPGRIENRTVDGAANPYLAPAVMLAAGLDGIAKGLPAGKRNDRNLYEVPVEELQADGIDVLPTTLDEALDELEQDEVVMEALGREYAQYYVRVKRAEWKRYHDSVSQWEIDNYLGLY
ncbi:MAG: type III glutamate--ammonia ligase [Candidatus Binatia bacterium]